MIFFVVCVKKIETKTARRESQIKTNIRVNVFYELITFDEKKHKIVSIFLRSIRHLLSFPDDQWHGSAALQRMTEAVSPRLKYGKESGSVIPTSNCSPRFSDNEGTLKGLQRKRRSLRGGGFLKCDGISKSEINAPILCEVEWVVVVVVIFEI